MKNIAFIGTSHIHTPNFISKVNSNNQINCIGVWDRDKNSSKSDSEKLKCKDYDNYIDLFKALANEDRLKIIQLLIKNEEMCAQDVEKHFFLEQSTTSHHLNTLRRAGITKARKKGRNVYYSINYQSFIHSMDEFKSELTK